MMKLEKEEDKFAKQSTVYCAKPYFVSLTWDNPL